MYIYCINSTYILYRSVCSLMVQSYTVQNEINPKTSGNTLLQAGILCLFCAMFFQECNPGIKRDLPVCMYVCILYWQRDIGSVLLPAACLSAPVAREVRHMCYHNCWITVLQWWLE